MSGAAPNGNGVPTKVLGFALVLLSVVGAVGGGLFIIIQERTASIRAEVDARFTGTVEEIRFRWEVYEKAHITLDASLQREMRLVAENEVLRAKVAASKP